VGGSPEGLVYRPEFVSPEEERDLLAAIEQLDFREIRMRGQTACRTARHFGFQRGRGEERRTFELELGPRSAYVLAGAARNSWQHSIPPTKGLRYSVTFPTLRS
jgi:alkylated DNA repair dioxygenase AlkB